MICPHCHHTITDSEDCTQAQPSSENWRGLIQRVMPLLIVLCALCLVAGWQTFAT